MGRRSKFPAEMRERAVRLVFEQQPAHESQWAAIVSIAGNRPTNDPVGVI
jgi:transposase